MAIVVYDKTELVDEWADLPFTTHIKYDIQQDGVLIWVNGIPETFIDTTDKF